MTPRERAERAKAILEDAVFKAVFADIRESIVSKLEACGVGDRDAHHNLTITLQLLKQLRTQLVRYTEELALEKAKAEQETWLRKAKQTLMP